VEAFLGHINIGVIAIQFAVLLFSISIHEASHGWMADRLGDYTARYLGRVTLNPLAHIDPIGTVIFPLLLVYAGLPPMGWAKPVPINSIHLRHPQRDHILVSLAGPGSNLLAGCIAFAILVALRIFSIQCAPLVQFWAGSGIKPAQQSILMPIVGILFFTLVINWMLAIFNLIPIPPLDGHWVLCELLPSNAAAVIERFGSYGFILLYALMYIGVFDFIRIPIDYMCSFLR
jgi:Zn-dependent protease